MYIGQSGLILGLASALMLILFGRIMGISGIVGTALQRPKNDTLWRLVFIAGLISSAIIFAPLIDPSRLTPVETNLWLIALAGLLVGYGSSREQLYVWSWHLWYFTTLSAFTGSNSSLYGRRNYNSSNHAVCLLGMKQNHHYLYKFLLGLMFGLGLIISGMIYPAKVIGFLNIFGVWDPSLAFVMLGGITVYTTVFHFLHVKKVDTLLGYTKSLPLKTHLDKKLIIGAVLFGVGWGLAGYCPGPALVSFGTFGTEAIVFVVAILGGMTVFRLTTK